MDDKQRIWVEAKEDIKEGEEITVQYYRYKYVTNDTVNIIENIQYIAGDS